MSALADKLRRARESNVEAGGRQFTIRRPTDVEAMEMHEGRLSGLDIICRHTVGWTLQEIDLVPGGSPVAAAFDAEAFREWVQDQVDVMAALAKAIAEAYAAHAKKREDAAKN